MGDGYVPLFETKEAKGRSAYRVYAVSLFVGICLIWFYRWTHVPNTSSKIMERWSWYGMLGAELYFGFYWILTQSVRWRPIYRQTFNHRLSQRNEKELPNVDIFVCTADPTMEPPLLVINTILSVMAYDYPSQKLSVYLSDDGGSFLTFYALLEASRFSKHWIPFCKRFKVESRSPQAYFSASCNPDDDLFAKERETVKKLYEEMAYRIETTIKLGRISEEVQAEHKGFSEWNSSVTPRDHQTILEILIDGMDPKAVDNGGTRLPTLVYMAREKRPQHHHNFKAGAMNALIRVSAEVSKSPIILNIDCDMYSNNPETVKDAMCFFMDDKKGQEIAYVQFPQRFENLTKHNLYYNDMITISEVEFPGLDGFGGPLYIGTGCFHRRDSLCGMKYSKEYKGDLSSNFERNEEKCIIELENRVKSLACCTAEDNTQWGKEMGLKYGCLVEDVITGLSIQYNGWKSIYLSPPQSSFLGVAPTTLEQGLVQHKRWSEGHFQVLLSKYSPFSYGHGKIKLGLRMAYSICGLWAPTSIPTLYYLTVPSLCLLNAIYMFPSISSPWFIPFAYVIFSHYTYSLCESLKLGVTLKAWWNIQRIVLFRRITSYLFAIIDTVSRLLGFSSSAFVLTTKVAGEEEAKRYEQEIMDFGSSSPMLVVIAVLAVLQLICFIGGVVRVVMSEDAIRAIGPLLWQFILCGSLILINIPTYHALFFRRDTGSFPTSVTIKSLAFALLLSVLPKLPKLPTNRTLIRDFIGASNT